MMKKNIILGGLLARKLNVNTGDKISLILPDSNASFAGYFPGQRFLLFGNLLYGSKEIDETLACISLENASNLVGIESKIHGFRLKYDDLLRLHI